MLDNEVSRCIQNLAATDLGRLNAQFLWAGSGVIQDDCFPRALHPIRK
jgi:hypothetical protein